MQVSEVLRQKGKKVITVRPEDSINLALDKFTKNSVGLLVVVDELEQVIGVISERDILRAAARDLEALKTLSAGDLMTREVIVGLPEDSLEYVMDLMTMRRFRHLPIMAQGKLAGIISIGDVVKSRAHHAEVNVRFLSEYIAGQYPV